MEYRIYPPIGIARVGNSDSFFIGPETPGSRGVDLADDGSETPVADYKDANFDTRKQAARFRVFQFADNNDPGQEIQLPLGARIEWSVRLVNKKDAVERLKDPPKPPLAGQRFRPMEQAGMADRIIDTDWHTIAGASAAGQALGGVYRGTHVKLGAIRSDGQGRLIVTGGDGRSEDLGGVPTGSGNYFDNRGHYDDVSDGPVTAQIVMSDGSRFEATPAWVVVGPPDYAPAIGGLVTLLDLILDVAYTEGWKTLPDKPSFKSDIQPLLERSHNHRWVNSSNVWAKVKTSGPELETPDLSDNAVKARKNIERMLVETLPEALSHTDRADTKFELRAWQKKVLAQWVSGDFDAAASAALPAAQALTHAALSGAVGYTLFPGIEVGVIMRDPSIYATPFDFRIDHEQVQPGDLTALMALPWQADFAACREFWWPAQRPNQVVLADGSPDDWERPVSAELSAFVEAVLKFGFVVPTTDMAGNPVQHESGRADAP